MRIIIDTDSFETPVTVEPSTVNEVLFDSPAEVLFAAAVEVVRTYAVQYADSDFVGTLDAIAENLP